MTYSRLKSFVLLLNSCLLFSPEDLIETPVGSIGTCSCFRNRVLTLDFNNIPHSFHQSFILSLNLDLSFLFEHFCLFVAYGYSVMMVTYSRA